MKSKDLIPTKYDHIYHIAPIDQLYYRIATYFSPEAALNEAIKLSSRYPTMTLAIFVLESGRNRDVRSIVRQGVARVSKACHRCDGTGLMSYGDNWENCQACNGLGFVEVES